MKSIATTVAIGILAVSPSVFAKGPKVDICHHASDHLIVINVSTNAVHAHFENHGDTYAGTYWRDADGDGHGDPNGATDECPNVGFVANADDCDDADPMRSPSNAEVCSDATDNNCDGAVDEQCISCPCFTLEEIEATYAEADVDTLVDTICEFDTMITDVWWEALWQPFPEDEEVYWAARESAVFASYSWWLTDQPYCYRSWNEIIWSDGEISLYEADQYDAYITMEQHEECVSILFEWADAQELSCIDHTLPPEGPL